MRENQRLKESRLSDPYSAPYYEGMLFNVIDKLVAAGTLKGKLHTGRALYNLN